MRPDEEGREKDIRPTTGPNSTREAKPESSVSLITATQVRGMGVGSAICSGAPFGGFGADDLSQKNGRGFRIRFWRPWRGCQFYRRIVRMSFG